MKIYLSWAFVCVVFSSTVSATDTSRQAMELAEQQKFEQALQLLAQEPLDIQNGYDHRYLKLRILSWSGKYLEAESDLDGLMQEYPRNADLFLAKANLEYYQGNLGAAERHYDTVLEIAPDYLDAQRGLENVRKARSTKNDWRIDGGTNTFGFDTDGIENWNDQYLRVEYTPENIAYSASVQHYDRFGAKDVQITAGISDARRGGVDWGLTAGVTPDPDFRPEFSLGANVGHSIETKGSVVLYPSFSYRFDQYDTGNIHTYQPDITAYFENGATLSARLIRTVQENGGNDLGWLTQGRMPLGDRLEVNIGYAQAPETIDGVAINTESIFGGLSYELADDFQLHLNVSQHKREDSYTRDSLNVGFTRKF